LKRRYSTERIIVKFTKADKERGRKRTTILLIIKRKDYNNWHLSESLGEKEKR